ncbi:excisionase family DNA-binding protein [Virgibacillus necropolis]|uniref:excisionase family DNA-binding protein n=1 Tax=Virgibacillus necropolis TaxID=163877 RepID=UPI00384C1004
MYLTIEETAEHLSIPESQIRTLIQQKRIRAIHDGEQFLINQAQFSTHFEQIEKYKQMIQDYLNEHIPEDIDVKDED